MHTASRALVERAEVERMTGDSPQYAILSHTWGAHEVVFQDVKGGTEHTKSPESRTKITKACEQARQDGYEYIWIDTCCIDKSNSSELSESINSMYTWYREAAICYAYLAAGPDGLDTPDKKSRFRKNRWFMRGWTLQELLAPDDVVFFSNDWTPIGRKKMLSPLLAEITGIDVEILSGDRAVQTASIAKRMSWAAHRETTRSEDWAYCLMGVFSVNMPMLYGEGGEKAFLRLQEEIMKESDDQSLFAWVKRNADQDAYHGLLAKSPMDFALSNSVLPYDDWEPRSPYAMTNRGLRIDMHLTLRSDGSYVAALDCPVPPEYKDSSFLAIYLQKLSDTDQQFARILVGKFGSVTERGRLQTIYIRQSPKAATHEAVLPKHVLQLRDGPLQSLYGVKVILGPFKSKDAAERISTRVSTRAWVPMTWPVVFEMPRGTRKLALVVVFERQDDGLRVAVMIGSSEAFQIAFDVIELDFEEDVDDSSYKSFADRFEPSTSGRFEGKDHSVRMTATSVVKESAKYYLVDIGIEALRSASFVEQAVHVYDVASGRDVVQADALSSSSFSGSLETTGDIKAKKPSLWKRLRS